LAGVYLVTIKAIKKFFGSKAIEAPIPMLDNISNIAILISMVHISKKSIENGLILDYSILC
jgi:hypothetical protein